MIGATTDHHSDLAVVTGGTRGIGRHLAEGFARAGYRVLLTATDAERARVAAEEIAAATGATVRGTGLEVADAESVRSFAATVYEAESETGTNLRVLVNNAGRIERTEGPLWEADPASLQAVVEANTLGPLLVINALGAHLLEVAAQTGEPTRIIDLNSGSGSRGTVEYAAYSATKTSLFRIAQSVHHYGYDKGLRIFEMAPGVIRSDMTHGMPLHDGREEWTREEDLVDLALALASGDLDAYSGRFVRAGVDRPEDLAAAAGSLTGTSRTITMND
ncbi:SDR family oxidoreductase [Brevibacterium samyangense]|uniref:Short-chain dehydrogenase n=1 Tax=Brevibacterium samyangense TaxID=366888 RepID=A0ABN2TBS2_9MICO